MHMIAEPNVVKMKNIPVDLVAIVGNLICYQKTVQSRRLGDRLEDGVCRILLR